MNDASLVFEPESSTALGFGFRAGFLGLLHMEIIQERLEREYNQNLITTVPNVEYRITKTNGEIVPVNNPAEMPSVGNIEKVEEPYIKAQIITPTEYIGNIMKLCMDRRGIYKNTNYLDPTRADITYEFPLSEIIFDFYDKLKSLTRGYASLDYDYLDYRESDLVKLDILLNAEPVDALSTIVHHDKAYDMGQKTLQQTEGTHPASNVRGGHPGSDRQQSDCKNNSVGNAEECAREMLRGRHLTKKKTVGETKRRQETYEAGGQSRTASGGISGGVVDDRLIARRQETEYRRQGKPWKFSFFLRSPVFCLLSSLLNPQPYS